MKRKLQFLTKTLLVAAALCVGSMSAWADVTPFSESYSSTSNTNGWTTGTAGRYTPAILNDGDNYFLSVDQSSTSRNNNGAIVTGSVISGKAVAGDDFTLTFDLRLGNCVSDQTPVQFDIMDASNSSAILSLKATAVNVTTWSVNNTSTTVSLPNSISAKNYSSADINGITWCSYKITRSGSFTYLTITNKATSEEILARTPIGSSSATGGLGKIVFTSKRYSSNFAIDNIVVRAVDAEADLPSVTYYLASFTDNTSGNEVTSGTTIYTDTERTTPITNGTLVDGTTYYYTATQTAYVDYQGSFTVDGTDPAVNFSMTAQPTYSYTVKAVDGSSNVLTELASGSSYNTATINYAYPEYFNVNGTLYTKAATSQIYGTSFTLSSDAQVENATYTASAYTDVIYYAEAESITGMTASNSGQGDARCSNRFGAYAGSDVEFITLPAGTYKIRAGFCGGTGTTFNINAGENVVWSAATTGSRGETDGENFTLDGSTALTIKAAGNNTVLLDNIIIQKVSTTNEVIGTADYATTFLGQKKSMTINKGQTINVTFKNYGGTSQWYNWLVRFYTTGLDNTLRADNFVLGDTEATLGTRSVKLGDADVTDWATFATQMKDATVTMTISYTAAGMFSISANAVGSSNTYVHSYAYKSALNNAINLELGVEKSWMEITSYSVTNPESVSKTISTAGWSTYCSPYILDFSSTIANLDAAYIVTGGAAGVLTKTPVTGAVPAGTGLLLMGTASAEVAIPVAATAGFDVTDNKLVGVTASETLTANSGYVLMTSPSLAFYKNNKDFTLSANSAYLPTDFDGSSAPVFLLFSGSETTGINAVQGSQSKANGDYYNLNGQRVAQPTKGLYIVNGKKVVVK
ncbi:MAG: hypothetical protein IJ647_08250 [Prevotella sp.]|nr:hypothetical protein [Prevotella sp.]